MNKSFCMGVFLCLMLVTMPNILNSAFAAETEIQLTTVINMSFIPGDNPLDGPTQSQGDPPTPTDFRASINGNSLSIEKNNETIPSAQATVVNASTGSIIINQQFTFGCLCSAYRNRRGRISRTIYCTIT